MRKFKNNFEEVLRNGGQIEEMLKKFEETLK